MFILPTVFFVIVLIFQLEEMMSITQRMISLIQDPPNVTVIRISGGLRETVGEEELMGSGPGPGCTAANSGNTATYIYIYIYNYI